MDRQRLNSTSRKNDFILKDKVDGFIQSRSPLSGQHRMVADTDESGRSLKGKNSKSQEHDPADERHRVPKDRDRKERKTERQEEPDDDFESDQYPRYNIHASPQLQRRRQQQQQDQHHKSNRMQGQLSPISTGRKNVQSPTIATPPRPSQTNKKKGTPIAIPSSPITQYERPRPKKPSTPTSTPSHISRKSTFSPSPTPKPSILKGPSTDLKLGRYSPLLDSDSDLEEDIFGGTPQGNQKKPKETRPTGSTRSASLSSSSSKDFEDPGRSRPQSKKPQKKHERSHHKASMTAGSRKEKVGMREGMGGDVDDDDDDDRSDFEPSTGRPGRPERRALDISEKRAKKSRSRDTGTADVDARPESWKITQENKELYSDIFNVPTQRRVGGGGGGGGGGGADPKMSANKKTIAAKYGDSDRFNRDKAFSNRGDPTAALSSKSGQSTFSDKDTKKNHQSKTMAKSSPDLQRKKFSGSTPPSTPSASLKDRMSSSTPKGKTGISDRDNSMPSPADHAALELFALDDGDGDNDDDNDDDDKPRRKRRSRRSQSTSSSSDSDRLARPSVGPMTPKRDRRLNTVKSSPSSRRLESANEKSPGSAVRHTGPRFSLPSPSKKIRMTIPSNLVFLSDDEIPSQALNEDEQANNICPYCGDILPKTQRMATALESVLAKLAKEQEERKQLQQQYQQRRQEQQKLKQQQKQQQQQIPVIDLEAGDPVGQSSGTSDSLLPGSKGRKSQPRPRPLVRNRHGQKRISSDKNNTLVVLDDDDHDAEEDGDDDDNDNDNDNDLGDDDMDDATNPRSLLYPPKVSLMEKFEFCRIHDAEALVVPMGLREEYPMHIDFSKLDERVAKIEADLRGIIERSVRSPYLEKALQNYERMGTLGARRPHVVLANVDQTLPGYYGSKGSAEMFRILAAMFIESNFLTAERAHPQKPVEYVQQVLIPETAMRLIQEDRSLLQQREVTLEEAQEVMTHSVEFGGYVHDVEQSHLF
ncbi:hypothetical protein EC968_002760 [Mortierella alpina]|nr:hypothetical protein EC968_002760 [Mortierella alpina]